MKKIFSYKWLVMVSMLLLPALLNAQQSLLNETKPSPDSTSHLKPKFFPLKLLNQYLNDTVDEAKKGFFVKPSTTVGVGYRIQKSANNLAPFNREHSLSLNYNLSRGGFFVEYKSLLYRAVGAWNLGIVGRADLPNVYNFFGVGNETPKLDKKSRYYRLRTSELYGGLSINRLIDSTHFLEFRPFYQSVKIKMDEDRIISDMHAILHEKELEEETLKFTRDHFAGAELTYHFQKTNHNLIPTRGLDFGISGAYVINTKNKDRNFTRYTSFASIYLPLSNTLTLATRVGGTTLQGSPKFYQLGTLGGGENLRGFNSQRFYGKTAFYNNNELRWLVPTSLKLFSKVGLLAFVDEGRVWQPGEVSKKWHVGYGGGVIIVPYNRLVLNGNIGFSKNDIMLHGQIGFLF